MKNSLYHITLFFMILLFPGLSSAANWTDITPGMSYKIVTVKHQGSNANINVLKVDLSKLNVKPVTSSKTTTVKELAQKNDALAMINANFFDKQGKTLGLVKIDKKVVHPIKNISWWSVLCIRYKRAQIIHTSKIKKGYCHQAVQAGPRLVVDGNIPKLKNQLTRNTAVGINKQGKVIFAVSQQPVPITKLAELFKKPENQGGLDCPNVLNLDGGSSSQMYVKAGKFNLDIANFVNVPVGLGVFKK